MSLRASIPANSSAVQTIIIPKRNLVESGSSGRMKRQAVFWRRKYLNPMPPHDRFPVAYL